MQRDAMIEAITAEVLKALAAGLTAEGGPYPRVDPKRIRAAVGRALRTSPAHHAGVERAIQPSIAEER